MISILIPVYNRDVTDLVKSLQDQCVQLGCDYEIRVYDDHSTELPLATQQLPAEVIVKLLSQNIGRSKIRNKLAQDARYDMLLFLDCDSTVTHPNFLKQYIDNYSSTSVIYGGTSYQSTPPEPPYYLHWLYGVKKEALLYKSRSKSPALHFHSNNFVVPKDVILKHPFDESIQGYGYEDVLLGKHLMSNGINIVHIDNPVQHDGLESCNTFLNKTREACGNLAELTYQNKLLPTKLTRAYAKLSKTGLWKIFNNKMKKDEQSILENLCSSSPSLYKLQLLKLWWYGKAYLSKNN